MRAAEDRASETGELGRGGFVETDEERPEGWDGGDDDGGPHFGVGPAGEGEVVPCGVLACCGGSGEREGGEHVGSCEDAITSRLMAFMIAQTPTTMLRLRRAQMETLRRRGIWRFQRIKTG